MHGVFAVHNNTRHIHLLSLLSMAQRNGEEVGIRGVGGRGEGEEVGVGEGEVGVGEGEVGWEGRR